MPYSISFYNTLTRTVEEFVPHEAGKVKLYTCGPTVYHYAHVGNLRSYIMEDLLEKALRYAGYEVQRAMNITDVGHLASDADTGEDKMLAGALREKKTIMEIAQMYTDAFFEDMKKLNNNKPEIVVPATSCIEEYIQLISQLLEKGYAYHAGENIYFDTGKLEDYYALVGHTSENLNVGVREDVEEDTNKRNKGDFVLWFTKSKFEDQALRWNSPWGEGYPGWHIECSAISIKTLGEYLDIHCGGVDNIFPHHTNEIAQSEAVLGHPWCKYWFHVNHLNMNSQKMSKSSGEFLTLERLMDKGYDPLVYRMFCLQSHYRKPLSFTYENLDNTKAAYNKLRDRVVALSKEGIETPACQEQLRKKFLEALGNDLNTSMALTVVYDVLKAEISDADKRALVTEFDQVLSLDLTKEKESPEVSHLEEYVLERIAARATAKAEKNYALADEIRKELSDKGVVLKDSKDGTTWSIES